MPDGGVVTGADYTSIHQKVKRIPWLMSDSEQARPSVRHLTVDEDSSGQRLDNFLTRELKGVPRTRLYKALRKGEIRVNKGRVRADYRLVAGDRVRIPPLRTPAPSDPPTVPRYWSEQLEQRIVYEDGGLLVINKPPGLAEAIDWVSALHALGVSAVERPSALRTVGSLAKTPDDAAAVGAALEDELSSA